MSSPVARFAKTVLQAWYSPSRFLWRLPVQAVALTFDDGPDPVFTPRLLDMLKRHNVTATFFVIGEKAAKHPALMRRIAQEGHVLGGHAMYHDEIPNRASNELAADLERCRRVIFDTSGTDTILFRPPRGRVDLGSIQQVCRLGYCMVHWTRTYSDYQRDGVQSLLERFDTFPPQPGDIVLLHDHNAYTVAALDQRLALWKITLKFISLPQSRVITRSSGR